MKLLVDTDAFCKLGVAGLLEDALHLFGAQLIDCGRLPALPYMLRRGALRRRYGAIACERLEPTAQSMPAFQPPSVASLEPFVGRHSIDAGEAQLFAAAMESQLAVITGDKRAILALSALDAVRTPLAGRVAPMEAVLLGLCETLDPAALRKRAASMAPFDQTVRVCFSSPLADPRDGLRSYFSDLAREVHPLLLWNSN